MSHDWTGPRYRLHRISCSKTWAARTCVYLLLGSGAFASPGTWSGSVSATLGPDSPLSIPLTIAKRELISVSVSGEIKLGDAPWSGPMGSDHYGFDPESMPPYGYSQGIIMMKINGNHFAIEGGSRALESPHAGAISLYVNDDSPGDNQGTFAVSITIHPGIVGDTDEDGLDDALEDQLLDQYAPYIKFDTEECVRPADVYWYLRNVDLLVDGNEDSAIILDRKQVPYCPEWFLRQVSERRESTNYLDAPYLVPTYCNIRNSHRYGPDWDRVLAAQNLGVYGHVVPTDGRILLQYWMFYGWNSVDAPLHVGDHEGDWELLQIFLDEGDPTNVSKMKEAIWHGHGKEFLAKWEAPGTWTWLGTRTGNCPTMPPPDGHAPIYVEAGTHGSWPFEVNYGMVGKNRGNSYGYVPTTVTNVGEAYRPRLGAEVILHFNGRWGAFKCCTDRVHCPEGPAIKGWWQASHSGNREAVYVGTWNNGQMTRNGRISWPYTKVGAAVGVASNGQTLIIYPGSYSESLTISKALTLKAPHGDAVIGQ